MNDPRNPNQPDPNNPDAPEQPADGDQDNDGTADPQPNK
jgi:hypothetical protein